MQLPNVLIAQKQDGTTVILGQEKNIDYKDLVVQFRELRSAAGVYEGVKYLCALLIVKGGVYAQAKWYANDETHKVIPAGAIKELVDQNIVEVPVANKIATELNTAPQIVIPVETKDVEAAKQIKVKAPRVIKKTTV